MEEAYKPIYTVFVVIDNNKERRKQAARNTNLYKFVQKLQVIFLILKSTFDVKFYN